MYFWPAGRGGHRPGWWGLREKTQPTLPRQCCSICKPVSPCDQPVCEQVRESLARLIHPVVDKAALQRLEAIEQERARELGLEAFKYDSNQEMLEVPWGFHRRRKYRAERSE